MESENERVRGVVLWFKNAFGFIHVEGDPQDIFIHYSNINMHGFKKLEKDQIVEFEIAPLEGKGRHAVNLEIIAYPMQ